jgi:cell division protein FtsI (penicillin-binding protein 3)
VNAWRHYSLLGFFVLACVGLSIRIVYLTVAEGEFLIDQGDNRAVRSISIPAYRGVVYDRFGEPLALSTPVAAIWTDPSKSSFSTDEIATLAQLLEINAQKLMSSLSEDSNREFLYLKRRVAWAQAQEVRRLGLQGVEFQPEYQRYYPAGETAAHIVGLTDIDDRGLEGIELSFNERLQGVPGRKQVLKDRKSHIIRNLRFEAAPRYGEDLTLSIDLRLQFLAYRELKTAVESHKATSGSVVMLDVATGEILALVNQPSYNPNDRSERTPAGMRNRAVTDTFEPGSTIKPFTALAALESGKYQRDTLIDTSPGHVWVGNKMIYDPGNFGVISLEQALKKSSQVGFAKVALSLDQRAVYDVLQRAGFSEYLGTGMPGEVAGSMSDEGLRYPVVRAVLGYGYGLAVTPLQLAQAYLCLATGGVRLPVSIIRQNEPPVGERVFSEELVWEVLKMMEGVTDRGGTATKARIDGFRVAGKTGTVRKVGAEGYDDERNVAWFVGIAPASRPRIVTVVVVNDPQASAKGGGAVAAPVYGRIMARALRLLGVSPDEVSAD